MKVCKHCKKRIRRKRANLFCSPKCAGEFVRIKYREQNPLPSNLSTNTIGSISELRVCCDLLMKGYEVFRSVSPNASVDLMIKDGKKFLSVEVTTGHYTINGNLIYPQKDSRKSKLIAVATAKGIMYFGKGFS